MKTTPLLALAVLSVSAPCWARQTCGKAGTPQATAWTALEPEASPRDLDRVGKIEIQGGRLELRARATEIHFQEGGGCAKDGVNYAGYSFADTRVFKDCELDTTRPYCIMLLNPDPEGNLDRKQYIGKGRPLFVSRAAAEPDKGRFLFRIRDSSRLKNDPLVLLIACYPGGEQGNPYSLTVGKIQKIFGFWTDAEEKKPVVDLLAPAPRPLPGGKKIPVEALQDLAADESVHDLANVGSLSLGARLRIPAHAKKILFAADGRHDGPNVLGYAWDDDRPALKGFDSKPHCELVLRPDHDRCYEWFAEAGRAFLVGEVNVAGAGDDAVLKPALWEGKAAGQGLFQAELKGDGIFETLRCAFPGMELDTLKGGQLNDVLGYIGDKEHPAFDPLVPLMREAPKKRNPKKDLETIESLEIDF